MVKKIWIIGIVLTIIIAFSLSAKSCVNRSGKKTKSGSSDVSTFTINTPSNLSATVVSFTQIDLSWTDNSNNDDGFEIERSPDGNAYLVIGTINSNTTSYSDTTVIPYSVYYYRVRAFNTIGDRSNYSNAVNVITFDYNWLPLFFSIAAGNSCSIAVSPDGSVWSWGSNYSGQLGVGDTLEGAASSFPIQIEYDYGWQPFNNIDFLRLNLDQYGYAISRKTDGTIWGWGANGLAQLGNGDGYSSVAPLQSNSDSDWSSFATGFAHALAIKADNSLWAWGQNDLWQLGFDSRATVLIQVGTQSDWSKTVSGWYHTMCIKTDKTMWGWGFNSEGRLGIGTTLANALIQINSDSDWSEIAAAYDHTIALKSNGTIWGWGGNRNGTLGLGDTTDRLIPVQAGSDSDWSKVSAGTFYTLALKTNNTLWSCGYNDYGQLGIGDTISRTLLTQINTDSDWAKIYSGMSYLNIAVKNDATIWSWGRNDYAQLGLGDTIDRFTPSQIGADSNWEKASIGYAHSIGLKTSGTIWGWGRNNLGQLGIGNTISKYTPAQIGTQSDWFDVFSGSMYSFGIKTNGILFAWGANGDGYLGLGDENNRDTPTQVNNNSGWAAMSCGIEHTVGLKTDGTLWTCGRDDLLQRYTESIFTPIRIQTDADWSGVAAGDDHSLAIKTNLTIWSWGKNGNGQLGLGNTVNRITPCQIGAQSTWSIVSAGQEYSLSIKTDQTLWAWGNNLYGRLGIGNAGVYTVPNPTQVGTQADWSKVTAGVWHALGLKMNGTIWSWGNSGPKLGLGTIYTGERYSPSQIGTQTDWLEISAGNSHSLGLKTDGSIWGWGYNTFGQLGLGDTIVRSIPCRLGSPSPVSALALVSPLSSQVNITWSDNAFNEAGFRIDVSTDGITYTLLSTLDANTVSYSDTGLTPGTCYYYRVNAFNLFGESPYAEAKITPTLAAPSLLTTFVVSSTQINLSWTDNSIDESGFWVWRFDGINWTQIATTTNTSYSDTTVIGGNTYAYRIQGYNGFGVSSYSATVTPTLTAPSLLTLVVISSTRIDLSWSDNSSEEAGFQIERKIDLTGTWSTTFTVGADVTTYSDETVIPGNVYYYHVRAYNVFANSDYSSAVKPSLPTPSLLTLVVISSTRIDLSWTYNSSEEAGFQIERKIDLTGTWSTTFTVGADVTTCSDETVIPGNVYYYHVRAYNAFVNSNYSSEKTTALTAPSLLTLVVISSTRIDLFWSDNSSEEAGFQIERKIDLTGTWSTTFTVGADITTYSDETVIPGNVYYYHVRAYNAFANSAFSSAVSPSLATPTLLPLVVISSARIDLSWADNSPDEDGFQIERATNISTSWSTTFTVGADVTTYSDETVTPGNVYYYRARAYNIFVNSAYSSVVTPALVAPSPLTVAILSETQSYISWTDNSPDEIGFKIERSFNVPGFYVEIGTTGPGITLYDDNTITAGNIYYYRVRAYNLYADGAYSNEYSAGFMDFGTGADGAGIAVITATNLNSASICGRGTADAVAFVVTNTVTAGASSVTITATPTGLDSGDEVMIINLKGISADYDNTGLYEFKRISSIVGSTINFTSALANSYGDASSGQRIMLQRVPNYTDVTVDSGASLTIDSWNGITGGVLAFRAAGTVTVNSVNGIDVIGKGFRKGNGTAYNQNANGGESYNGTGGTGGINTGNGNTGQGGGGGGGDNDGSSYIGAIGQIGSGGGGGGAASNSMLFAAVRASGGGGGGGGYGSAGSGGSGGNGIIGCSGYDGSFDSDFGTYAYCYGGHGGGGGIVGDSYILNQRMYMGGGGAAGGGAKYRGTQLYSSVAGGNGGGIIFISASTITVISSASISANGNNASIPNNGTISYPGGSGGGAGGTIILLINNLINSGSINANGGNGSGNGGNGGGGRTYARYSSISGNDPTPNYSGP